MQNLLLLISILAILSLPMSFFWYLSTVRETFEPMPLPSARKLNSIVDIALPRNHSIAPSYADELTLKQFKEKVVGLVNIGTYPNTAGWASVYPDTQHLKEAFQKLIVPYTIEEEEVIQCKRESSRTYYQVEWVMHRPGKRYGFHLLVEAHESIDSLKWSNIKVLGLVPEDLIIGDKTPKPVMDNESAEQSMPIKSLVDSPVFSHDWEKGIYCKKMSDFKKQFGITPQENPQYDCSS